MLAEAKRLQGQLLGASALHPYPQQIRNLHSKTWGLFSKFWAPFGDELYYGTKYLGVPKQTLNSIVVSIFFSIIPIEPFPNPQYHSSFNCLFVFPL